MPNRFGPRGVLAILVPLQNANMQPEYERMRPPGVSNQIYRFDISDHGRVRESVLDAVPGTLGCRPDMIVCGNSLEMRHWSVDKQREYRKRLAGRAGGVPVITATDACEAALRTLGAKRIAVLSPMSEEYSKSVQGYYQSLGFEAPYATWLKIRESIDIIDVGAGQILAAFREIDHDDVDTFVHVGGALGMVDMIEDLEASLGRPVVSVNAATYWYALRRHGIDDPMPGFGQLLMRTDIEA